MDNECSVCFETATDWKATSCCNAGLLCMRCYEKLRSPTCPFCRAEWGRLPSPPPPPAPDDFWLDWSRIRRRYIRRVARLHQREVDRERNRQLSRERKLHSMIDRIIREELEALRRID